MTTLVVGASGATGRLLLEQLLNRGQRVKAMVRSPDKLPDALRNNGHLTVINASILELSDAELAQHVNGCDAVASCLGHNLNLKGIYGHSRRLVTEATRRLCKAIKTNTPAKPVKFVLMNTTGNSNRDLLEPISVAQRLVVGLIRFLLPPQADNEQAAEFLRTTIGQHDKDIGWVAVRPDSLKNANAVTAYEIHPSPIRSALFNPGVTSRINVAHFMADLISDDATWNKWKGQMPVIYNSINQK